MSVLLQGSAKVAVASGDRAEATRHLSRALALLDEWSASPTPVAADAGDPAALGSPSAADLQAESMRVQFSLLLQVPPIERNSVSSVQLASQYISCTTEITTKHSENPYRAWNHRLCA
jgi:hypothetical protein